MAADDFSAQTNRTRHMDNYDGETAAGTRGIRLSVNTPASWTTALLHSTQCDMLMRYERRFLCGTLNGRHSILYAGPVGPHATRSAEHQFRVEQAVPPSQGDRQRLFRRLGRSGKLPDHHAGGPHSDQHGLRGNRAGNPRGGREAGFQVYRYQDYPTRTTITWRATRSSRN